MYERLSIIPEDLRGVGIQLSKLEKIAKTNKALAKFLNQPSNGDSNLTDRNELFDNSMGGIQDNNVKISHNKNTNFTTMEKTVTQDIKSSSKQDKVTGTVSKRGRSRGNMNTLKATSNLTNYFKHTKNESATKEVYISSVCNCYVIL